MMKPKYVLNEIRRVCGQYATAVRADSQGDLRRVLPSLHRIATARTRYGVGPVYYSLYQFSRVPRQDWGDYVTDDPVFKQFLLDGMPESCRHVALNKLAFHDHCVANGLPCIPVLCVVSDDASFDGYRVARVSRLEEWREVMARAPDEMFVKTIDGTYGEGAFSISRTEGGFSFDGRVGSPEDVFHFLREQLAHERGWLVQPRMRTHESLAGIVAPRGLATVRAVTCMRDGKPELLVAGMKITVGDSITDNFAKGAAGNLLAGIDRDTGVLTAAWGSTDRRWPVMAKFERHPDSGRRIEGFALPFWADLVDVAMQAQQSMPLARSIGWDIAATTDGVVLVEANSRYDVSILQIAHQRGLKRDLLTALEGRPTAA